jgi:hypothetical protein
MLIGLACLVVATPAEATWREAPVVPSLDAATVKHVESLSDGPGRKDVFAKVGDSISTYETFLQGFGCGPVDVGGLRSTVQFFRERRLPAGESAGLCPRENSFSRKSLATRPGESSPWPMQAGVLSQELRAIRPGWLLLMMGTNDARLGHTVGEYRRAMSAIIAATEAQGAVPILSTMPPRLDDPTLNWRVESYNGVVYRLARSQDLPLINLWRALQPLPNFGLLPDGVHLTSGDPRATDLSGADSYGANLRNLITLRTLKRLVR